jgi:phosphate transport system permease protein
LSPFTNLGVARSAPASHPPARSSPKKVLPGLRTQAGDRAFRALVFAFGASVIVLAVAIAWQLAKNSSLVWTQIGPAFLWRRVWDPVSGDFGALPFIYGTLVSSGLALLISVPLGLGSAIFLAELAPPRLSNACCFLIELLAAIPSVIIGLMGIFLLTPVIRGVEPWLNHYLGFLPFFKGSPYGVGMLAAGLTLSIMVLPYITSISRDVIMTVPRPLKEAALALGATRWEMVRMVVLPYARSGILGSGILGLGRALGETMAVTMVIGNTPRISASLLDPAYSMAAVIANEFAEAVTPIHTQALIAIALVLFCVTLIVNGLARLMIYRLSLRGVRPL